MVALVGVTIVNPVDMEEEEGEGEATGEVATEEVVGDTIMAVLQGTAQVTGGTKLLWEKLCAGFDQRTLVYHRTC